MASVTSFSLFPVNICVLGFLFLQCWHSAKGYVQELRCFPAAWHELQEDKPKHGKILCVYNTDILPLLGWNDKKNVSFVQSLLTYTGILTEVTMMPFDSNLSMNFLKKQYYLLPRFSHPKRKNNIITKEEMPVSKYLEK